jgi:pentatricopeptide repeat protein
VDQVDSITHIWTARVIPGSLKPPTGTCLQVLNLAARLGDVRLATDVFRVLAARDAVLTSSHYEMLLEAYLNAGDLDSALSVILIMGEAGIKVDEESIHPLFTYLRDEKERPMDAFAALQGFEMEGRKVPTAAVNVCLHAAVHLERMEDAIDMYKKLHTASQTGPNTQTFNILFQGCHKAGLKELAMFLAAEMTKLKIAPDTLTYDRLVLTCCEAHDLTDAVLYYEEMRLSNFVPRRGTFMRLISEGILQGDPVTPTIMADMKKCGMVSTRQLEFDLRERFPEGLDKTAGQLDSGTQVAHAEMQA